MTNIGKEIFKRRVSLGMSQEELAKKVGYKDRSSIAKIESGERDIRQKKVVDFAKALQTTPASLMGYDEGKKEADHQKVVVISPHVMDLTKKIPISEDKLKTVQETEKILLKMNEKDLNYVLSLSLRLLESSQEQEGSEESEK